jgi:exopolysaccharide biosynthesis protein
MDGGGSTTLSVNGKVMNKPSGGSERTLPTHILVFDDQKK